MLDWIFWLLPDWGWRTGLETVRDVVTLLVGGLGTYLAGQAIKMGRNNERVTNRQVEILGRLAELDEKQADIAETQHQILQEQLSKRLDLRLRGTEQHSACTVETTPRSRATGVDARAGRHFLQRRGGCSPRAA